MGKRSDFERRPQDFYPTPAAAVKPLLLHLQPETRFIEPCAGDGALVKHLEGHDHQCSWASDLSPRSNRIHKIGAIELLSDPSRSHWKQGETIITNPPWEWRVVEPLLEAFLKTRRVTWLLLPHDFACNKRSQKFMERCERIVPIGRVKWIPDSKYTGKDNVAWFKFCPEPVLITAYMRRAA